MTGLHLVAEPVQFDRCPPLASGACMVEHGHTCAMSAECCVKAPVAIIEAVRLEASRAVSEWKYGEGDRWKRAA